MWGKRGSKDWPKRKLKFDFDGTAFRVDWGDGQRRKVEEVNLHSGYDEPGPGKTYMREVLAASAFERTNVPAPAAKHVVLRRNGEFFGLYVAVENVDGEFLERKGESPSGPCSRRCTGGRVTCAPGRRLGRRAGTTPSGRATGERAPRCTGTRRRRNISTRRARGTNSTLCSQPWTP